MYTGKLIACHLLSLLHPPSSSPPVSAFLNYMISQWKIGGKERLRFLQQQLVHLFTPHIQANEAVYLHNLV